jgi:outer membrane protein assembly factor BamD (BamD/ComL family)
VTTYAAAMDAYTKVIESKSVDADYAYFQKLFLMVLCLKMTRKLINVLQLYPKSEYRDDALLNWPIPNVAENQNDLAVKRTTD